MIKKNDCLIFKEMCDEDINSWFDLKDKKFLHNIDTFYYSIKLVNDFTRDSDDVSCQKLREFFSRNIDRSSYEFCKPINDLMDIDTQLNLRPFHFASFYNINIECPELFDIFIADTVPANESGECVTSEIIVQLRSYLLWQYGCTKAFEYSYSVVEQICNFFDLQIREVKENRVDYCWHSNYLQNPEKFFRIDNFSKMQVSRFKRIHYEYCFKPDNEYEGDYIALGKRSDKVFVRIYLKSKEVVEKGYKPWFFKEWFFNSLINRYDLYVYEKAFVKKSWKYIDMARLEFYSEFGKDKALVKLCKSIVSGTVEKSDSFIKNLADELTPAITLITNVEYQTTRRMSKSYQLLPLKDNSSHGVASRIYDYLDNRPLITEYLTHSTLRLVDYNECDENKSRADYCNFWNRLRACKMVDVKKAPKDLKLIRNYTRNLNAEVVKKRAMSSAVTFSLYTRGINDNSGLDDAASLLLALNDNDIHDMKRIKSKRIKQLNNMLTQYDLYPKSTRFTIVNNDTGEVISCHVNQYI